MAANVIGLIEMETDMAGAMRWFDDDGLGLSPSFPARDEDVRTASAQTASLRADLDQLNLELESAFAELLQRLFQGD